MKPCCLAHCPESVSLSIHHHCDPCDSLVCIWQCFLSKILKNLRIILHLIYKNRSFGWPKHFTPTLYSKSRFACTTNIQDPPPYRVWTVKATVVETCLLHHSPDSIAGNMLGYILCHSYQLDADDDHFQDEMRWKWPEKLRKYAPTKGLTLLTSDILTFGIWQKTFRIWNLTFEVWYLTYECN